MFSPSDFIKEASSKILESVKGRAIVAVSGGVDSTVAAKIASDSLGSNLLAVYVDTGLMREGENLEVEKILKKLKIQYVIVRARKKFLDELKGVTNPETKRRIIGRTFIRIFEKQAKMFKSEFLVQGTIAPDWIESGGGLRDRIKSHHNVGGLPNRMNFKIYEPLRDLYKDEVRKIARYYGIPSERQPYPGPGLAVRIMGEVTQKKLYVLRKATAILEKNVDGMNPRPWQYFAVLLSNRTTGVHGDRRVYGYTIAIRCVDSLDGMTANFSSFSMETLGDISREITNKIPGIGRVVYDITDKPPGTIEWE